MGALLGQPGSLSVRAESVQGMDLLVGSDCF